MMHRFEHGVCQKGPNRGMRQGKYSHPTGIGNVDQSRQTRKNRACGIVYSEHAARTQVVAHAHLDLFRRVHLGHPNAGVDG